MHAKVSVIERCHFSKYPAKFSGDMTAYPAILILLHFVFSNDTGAETVAMTKNSCYVEKLSRFPIDFTYFKEGSFSEKQFVT